MGPMGPMGLIFFFPCLILLPMPERYDVVLGHSALGGRGRHSGGWCMNVCALLFNVDDCVSPRFPQPAQRQLSYERVCAVGRGQRLCVPACGVSLRFVVW